MVMVMFVEVAMGKRVQYYVLNVEDVSVFGEDLSRGNGETYIGVSHYHGLL